LGGPRGGKNQKTMFLYKRNPGLESTKKAGGRPVRKRKKPADGRGGNQVGRIQPPAASAEKKRRKLGLGR